MSSSTSSDDEYFIITWSNKYPAAKTSNERWPAVISADGTMKNSLWRGFRLSSKIFKCSPEMWLLQWWKKKKLFVLISINKKSIMIKKKTQGNNSMLQKRIKLVTPVYPEKSWHKHTKWACYILYQTHYGFKTIFIVYISSQNLVSNIFYDVKLAHNVFPQLIYPRGLHE